jgi:hypothetical protein
VLREVHEQDSPTVGGDPGDRSPAKDMRGWPVDSVAIGPLREYYQPHPQRLSNTDALRLST